MQETNNTLLLGDCLSLLKNIPDNSVDLVITDPPYEFICGGQGGSFGNESRSYHREYINLAKSNYEKLQSIDSRKVEQMSKFKMYSDGFDFKVLDECCRVLKAINIYVWCSKAQVRKLLEYFENKGCTTDILTWHKTNPIPTCCNTYLSDTEYLIFAKQKGVKVGGRYETKRKYYVSEINVDDKKKWKHPTIKPLNIIENLIINSSQEGEVVLDCFMGSGTTGVACKNLNRKFIGMELNEEYYNIACERINKGISSLKQIDGQMDITSFLK